jgi:TPR repeat protein
MKLKLTLIFLLLISLLLFINPSNVFFNKRDHRDITNQLGNFAEQGYTKAQEKIREVMADQGNAEAQYDLAVMYQKGNNVTKNAKQAFKWYKKAAGQGHAKAQYNLAEMYQKGDGVLTDYNKALHWNQEAADQGSIEAQYKLGIMYTSSDLKDLAKAKFWFEKVFDNEKSNKKIEKSVKRIWDKHNLWQY